jgi:hypothetical protein
MRTVPILLFFAVVTASFAASPVQPITINPTIKTFDSIPTFSTKRRFLVGTVQDSSIERDETGVVGATRIRRRKTAPIICTPLPALVIKRSLEGLLVKKGINTDATDSTGFTVRILLLDFSLTETSKRVSQTMNAAIAMQITLISQQDGKVARQFIVKCQNSKSTVDTTKHAEAILRGALESALKEILKNIAG